MYVWNCDCDTDGSCDCAQQGVGLSGMGFTIPGSSSGGYSAVDMGLDIAEQIPEVGQFVQAGEFLYRIGRAFGIGKGRAEADMIAPVANSLVNPEGTGRLNEIVRDYPHAGLTQLQDYYNELATIKAKYLDFLHDERFTDGRASAQAEADMIPLIDDNIYKIEQRIVSLGGITQPPQITQNTGTWQPRLNYPAQSTFPAIPQAGVIWPNTKLPNYPPQRVEQVGAGMDSTTMLLIGGAALAFFLGKRR